MFKIVIAVFIALFLIEVFPRKRKKQRGWEEPDF